MNRTVLLLGGARSGKSRYGQSLARKWTNAPVYLATSREYDDEHRARIARHREDRGPEWKTLEEPLEIAHAARGYALVLLDCVTLWLTNVFEREGRDLELSLSAAKREIDACHAQANTWIWISNELGQGVHASTQSARRFVDLQGFVNQYLASQVHTVALMVAGIPVAIKGDLE